MTSATPKAVGFLINQSQKEDLKDLMHYVKQSSENPQYHAYADRILAELDRVLPRQEHIQIQLTAGEKRFLAAATKAFDVPINIY